MIPDFPVEKEKLMKFWIKYLEAKFKERLGVLNEIPSHRNHEGHRWILNRSDGSGDENQYKEIHSMFTIEAGEVPDLTPEKIIEKLNLVAEEMAKQFSQGIFADMARAADSVGNSVNANGQPVTQELFLQMIERLLMDFDESGNLIPPMMFISPDFAEKYFAKMKSWENDPNFTARHAEIIARKREEWLDRENHRKLVD